MRLHILGTGEDFYIEDVSLDWTVQRLRNTVASRLVTPVPSEQVKLLFMGRVLRDSSTLSEINIADEQTVHMVLRPVTNTQTHQSSSTDSSGINVETFTSSTPQDIVNLMNGFLAGQLPTNGTNMPNIFGGLQGAMQVSQLFSRGFGGANNTTSSATHQAQDSTNGAMSVNIDTPSQPQQSGNVANETVQPHIEVITITTDGQDTRVDGATTASRASRNSSRRTRTDRGNPDITTRFLQSPPSQGVRMMQQPHYMYSPPPQPVRVATVTGVQIHLHVSLAEMEQVPEAVDRLNAHFANQNRHSYELPVTMAGSGGFSSAADNVPIPANIVTAMMTRSHNTSARTPNIPTSPVRATSVKAPHPAAERPSVPSAASAPSRAPAPELIPPSPRPPAIPSTPSEPLTTAVPSVSSEVLVPQVVKTILGKLEMPIDFMLLQQGDWTPASRTRLKVNAVIQKALDDVRLSHSNCGEAEAKGILAAASAKGFVRDHVYNIPILAAEVARHSKSPSSIKVNPMSFIERSVFHIIQHLLEMYTSTPTAIQQRNPYKIVENSAVSPLNVLFQSLPANDRIWCLTLRMGLVKTIGAALVFAEREIANNGRKDVEEILGKAINMIFVDFILPEAPSLGPMRGMALGFMMQTLVCWRAEYIKKFLRSNIDNATDDEKKFTEEIPDYEAMVRNTNPTSSKAVAGGKKERTVHDGDTTLANGGTKQSDPSVDSILESAIISSEFTGEPDAKKDGRSEARDSGPSITGEGRRSDRDSSRRCVSHESDNSNASDTFASVNSSLD